MPSPPLPLPAPMHHPATEKGAAARSIDAASMSITACAPTRIQVFRLPPPSPPHTPFSSRPGNHSNPAPLEPPMCILIPLSPSPYQFQKKSHASIAHAPCRWSDGTRAYTVSGRIVRSSHGARCNMVQTMVPTASSETADGGIDIAIGGGAGARKDARARRRTTSSKARRLAVLKRCRVAPLARGILADATDEAEVEAARLSIHA